MGASLPLRVIFIAGYLVDGIGLDFVDLVHAEKTQDVPERVNIALKATDHQVALVLSLRRPACNAKLASSDWMVSLM
jgi:hypothetical protein